MMTRFELKGADGKAIRGDRADGEGRQILFITGFLSKRWGNKSKALAQWCQEQGWGFCCYDVRGFGDSEGAFTDYTLADWIADARLVLNGLRDGPATTIVGNSLGGWIAWLMAQEFEFVDRLILIAPAFNMMGVRAAQIPAARRQAWQTTGWMPWDDEPLHKDWPLSWKWVEESEAYWKASFDRLRPVSTAILHGMQDSVILPEGSRRFVETLLERAPAFPIELDLIPGDHRLSSPEHVDMFRRLVLDLPK
ncbi:alpha/beta hydrolase [Nitrospira sp. NS4]|uniref:alpha/beta hydrolase n=1 Tax=Nitrospira sp. NS4 TaxID=3414498 RepID=UPI003C2EB42C